MADMARIGFDSRNWSAPESCGSFQIAIPSSGRGVQIDILVAVAIQLPVDG